MLSRSTNGPNWSKTLVDSALAGSHDDVWLSWAPDSLPASGPRVMSATTQITSTTYLLRRPQTSRPIRFSIR